MDNVTESKNMSKKSGKTMDVTDREAVKTIAEAILPRAEHAGHTAVDTTLEDKRVTELKLEEASVKERQDQLKTVAAQTKQAVEVMRALSLEVSKLRGQQKQARNVYDKLRLENLTLRVRVSQGLERIATLKGK